MTIFFPFSIAVRSVTSTAADAAHIQTNRKPRPCVYRQPGTGQPKDLIWAIVLGRAGRAGPYSIPMVRSQVIHSGVNLCDSVSP